MSISSVQSIFLCLVISTPGLAHAQADDTRALAYDLFEDEAEDEIEGLNAKRGASRVNDEGAPMAGFDDDPDWDDPAMDDLESDENFGDPDEFLDADPMDDFAGINDDPVFDNEDPPEDFDLETDNVSVDTDLIDPDEDLVNGMAAPATGLADPPSSDGFPAGEWLEESDEEDIVIPVLQ